MKSKAWNVYSCGDAPTSAQPKTSKRPRCIDTVFFDADMDADAVTRSLIGHDGYPSDIEVRERFPKLG